MAVVAAAQQVGFAEVAFGLDAMLIYGRDQSPTATTRRYRRMLHYVAGLGFT
jgi:hypothetical protein